MRQPLPTPDEIAALPPDGGPEFNRLIHEQSPYLLQHARNPVDWYPWGDEAFDRARREDRPVFLSVGYATCHWCHVMEHESFEDPLVAAVLDDAFVCVKVDREERPDVDHTYMTAVQLMTGSGGWPMTVVLTPDGEPFFAGTYFPKEGGYGRPGLLQVAAALSRAWREDRETVLGSAARATEALQRVGEGVPGPPLDRAALDDARSRLAAGYDREHGGFGTAPKFPSPHQLLLLLRHHHRTGDAGTLRMVTHTLRRMRDGGMYDHVGYGFHRYSTDREWVLPHFEKMLYDQAMLSLAYLEAYQVTGDEALAATAREVFTYVLRDLTGPEGGFHSAEDADSEGEEGRFYVWTLDELRAVLPEADAALFAAVHGFTAAGNFVDQASGQRTGANVVHRSRPLDELAREHDLAPGELRRRLEEIRAVLFDVRQQRPRPLLDDKVLTDWNGLMIAALARGGQVLDEPSYTAAARRAADFCLAELRDADGRLLKRYRAGVAGLPAHLDDHAFLVWGLLELYQASFEARYLGEAVAVADEMLARFWDEDGGGLFLTAADEAPLLVRSKEFHDAAIPAGNSVAAMDLLWLARLTGDPTYERRAEALIEATAGAVRRSPEGFAFLLCAADFALGPSHEVVVAGAPGAADTAALLAALRRPFLPRKVVVLRPDPGPGPIGALAPYVAAQTALDGAAAAYVCRGFACERPTTDPGAMLDLLAGDGPERT